MKPDNFIFYNCFHDSKSHFNGFGNTFIIQMSFVWSNYFICVKCNPVKTMHLVASKFIVFLHMLLECPFIYIENAYLFIIL